VATLLALVLTAGALVRVWSWLALAGVSAEHAVRGHRVFPGEAIHLNVRVANRKPFPLPWVLVEEEFPPQLAPEKPPHGSHPESDGCTLSRMLTIPWYRAARWSWQLRGNRRGFYRLGPLRMTSGDVFGLCPRVCSVPLEDAVIVYPRISSLAELGIPSHHPMGEARARRRIMGDPTRPMAIRDYFPGDSLRRIHWKASARHGKLQVMVHEPTTSPRASLFLVMDSFQAPHGLDEETWELGISVAASLAHDFLGRNCPTGLFVNGLLADTRQPAVVPPGAGAGQEVLILETLAKLTPAISAPFQEFVERERGALAWGSTLAFVASRPSRSLDGLIDQLQRRGHQTLRVRVNEAGGEDGNWHCVRSSGVSASGGFGGRP
jgi:uncharacterized protein (DUF58 family)